jgi:hypothetical protein
MHGTMAAKCHVCGKTTTKPLEVPVCGDPNVKLPVCSKRCRDEYLAGYVETRGGRAFRLLARPRGAGIVLAIVWAAWGVVHIAGGALSHVLPLPLLPPNPGPEFYTGGAAGLFVAFALLREMRWARLFSIGLAAVGLVFAALYYLSTRHLSWVVEGVTVFPAALLLSLGDPGPKRALGALALFGIYPAAVLVTAATGTFATTEQEDRLIAQSYEGLQHADVRSGLRLTVPEGWYILRGESDLLPHDGAMFRAVRAHGSVALTVHDRPVCDPQDPRQLDRVLRGISAGGGPAGMVGDPQPVTVVSALGEGVSFFVGRNEPAPPRLWYLVFLPWTEGRCIELRCGGPSAAEPIIRSECLQIGARAISQASASSAPPR